MKAAYFRSDVDASRDVGHLPPRLVRADGTTIGDRRARILVDQRRERLAPSLAHAPRLGDVRPDPVHPRPQRRTVPRIRPTRAGWLIHASATTSSATACDDTYIRAIRSIIASVLLHERHERLFVARTQALPRAPGPRGRRAQRRIGHGEASLAVMPGCVDGRLPAARRLRGTTSGAELRAAIGAGGHGSAGDRADVLCARRGGSGAGDGSLGLTDTTPAARRPRPPTRRDRTSCCWSATIRRGPTFSRDLMPSDVPRARGSGHPVQAGVREHLALLPVPRADPHGPLRAPHGGRRERGAARPADDRRGAPRCRLPHDARRQVPQQLGDVRPASGVRSVGVRRSTRAVDVLVAQPVDQRGRRVAAPQRLSDRHPRRRRRGVRRVDARRPAVLRDVLTDHAAPARRTIRATTP